MSAAESHDRSDVDAPVKTEDWAGPERRQAISNPHSRNHDQTMKYARSALDRIEKLKHPADPPSFEVWYSYSTGQVADLNKAIDVKLQSNSRFGPIELEQLYDQYLSPLRAAEKVEGIGNDLGAELDRVLSTIDQAITASSGYGDALAAARQALGRSQDIGSLKTLVFHLIEATRLAADENRGLHAKLNNSKQAIDQLQTSLGAFRAESLTDALTNLGNRKHFDQALNGEISRCNNGAKPFSLLVCDVDHFKSFNDTFGHVTGDHVLRLIATTLKQSIRPVDIAARYGGEEFATILPDTSLHEAATVAETIRNAVMVRELIRRTTGERLGRVTISIGVAEFQLGESSESLVERADSCLYAAKRGGRNRVMTGPRDFLRSVGAISP